MENSDKRGHLAGPHKEEGGCRLRGQVQCQRYNQSQGLGVGLGVRVHVRVGLRVKVRFSVRENRILNRNQLLVPRGIVKQACVHCCVFCSLRYVCGYPAHTQRTHSCRVRGPLLPLQGPDSGLNTIYFHQCGTQSPIPCIAIYIKACPWHPSYRELWEQRAVRERERYQREGEIRRRRRRGLLQRFLFTSLSTQPLCFLSYLDAVSSVLSPTTNFTNSL